MSDDEPTRLLNVDLDIISESPLDPLVAAFGDRVDVLYVGKWGRRYGASLEVGGSGYQDEANNLINRFVSFVESLPRSPRRLWNEAKRREFNVGIEAAHESPLFEWRVKQKTLDGIMRVKGTIVVTVYAPVRVPLRSEKQHSPSRARRK